MPGATKFGSEFLINTSTANDQDDPAITALTDGRFLVAWEDSSEAPGDTDGLAIRAQLYNADGSKFGSEFVANTTTTNGQFNPSVTALAGGRFVVAWTDSSFGGGDNSGNSVRAQVFNADGSKSGSEFLVNTTIADTQDFPDITALTDGRFVVAWQDSSTSGGDLSSDAVRAQVFNPDGSKSGLEFLVNTTTANDQADPAIAALADGRFVVAWEDSSATGGDTSVNAVRAQIFNANGSKSGTEFLVNTTTADDQADPAVTALADGRFVVAWRDESSTGGDTSDPAVRGQVFNANGSKSGAEFLVNTTTTSTQSDPEIAALPDGRFVVVFADFSESGGDTFNSAVRGQVFNGDGSKSGAEFLVNTTTSDDQSDPTVTVLADGRFVVAWEDDSATGGDTSLSAVRGQIFDPREEALILSGTTLGEDFVGTGFDDFIDGRGGGDRVQGAGGNDTLLGGAGDDTVSGGSGNDTLDGGLGADLLEGGVGDDKYVLANGTDTVAVDAGGTDTVTSTITRSLAALGTIENLTLLGSSAINGVGNNLANTIVGNSAANALAGGVGNDTLDGGLGGDGLNGGSGDDTYVLGNGADGVADSAGIDTITSTITRSLASFGTIEKLTLLGTAAINGTGNGLNNTVTGNAAANVLDGGLGLDILIGGAGNDTYTLANGTDAVSDSAGVDTVTSTITRSLASFGTIEKLTLLGGTAINGTGNALANTIIGNGAANALFGVVGNDRLEGGAGNDRLDGGVGVDTMIGGVGNDTYLIDSTADVLIDSSGIDVVVSTVSKRLATGFENLSLLGSAGLEGIGNAAANVINGNGGNNRLSGLDGNDIINGGAGLDRLTGGLGKDVLTGGAGDDDFDYNTVAELGTGAARDVIKDFTAGDDIDLSTIDGNGTTAGNAFTFLAGEDAAFTGVAGQLRFRHLDAAGTANDITIVEGDINGNRVADFQLQVNGLKNFAAADFIL